MAIKTAALKLNIRTNDSRPIFKQIVDGISMNIATGALEPGVKLPSVRALAMQLSVNPNTVAKAYSELTNRHMVDARPGLGLFVSVPKQTLNRAERKARLDEAVSRFINDVIHLQLSHEEIIGELTNRLQQFGNLEKAAGE